ncbi:hypothetical protein D8Y24_05395 [Agrococcus lahaulensis]|nr:hypothetical protein D8Y24_05395 [Agrococcus lahaulensis]
MSASATRASVPEIGSATATGGSATGGAAGSGATGATAPPGGHGSPPGARGSPRRTTIGSGTLSPSAPRGR